MSLASPITPDRPASFQANMDSLVRSLGHLILMKVDPAAARSGKLVKKDESAQLTQKETAR